MTSHSKAEKFAKKAADAGWATEVKANHEIGGDTWETHCTRGEEYIYIFWLDNTLIETPKYTFMGQTMSLHNAATAARQLTLEPDVKRAYRKATRKASVSIHTEVPAQFDDAAALFSKRDLPFTEEDDDAHILKQLRGSNITYWNELSKQIEEEAIPHVIRRTKDSIPQIMNADFENVFFLEDNEEGKTWVSFMNPNGVFRAIYLDRILEVH